MNISEKCASTISYTDDDVNRYLKETDPNIRLEMIYEFQFGKDLLLPGDYDMIIDDIDAAREEFLSN